MKIGIIGTGVVGRSVGAALGGLGHETMLGTRDLKQTMERTGQDAYGNPPFSEWIGDSRGVKVGTFAEAAAHGELVVNATEGAHSIEALKLSGEANLRGKILIDLSNPLDFSKGMPPSLLVCNTDSLGERIQKAFPEAKVVKTLNTVNALVMANPGQVKGADHTVFMSGNDAGAKDRARGLLKSLGWQDIIDLGDITTARGTEMILPLWVRLFGVLKSPMFNFKVVR